MPGSLHRVGCSRNYHDPEREFDLVAAIVATECTGSRLLICGHRVSRFVRYMFG